MSTQESKVADRKLLIYDGEDKWPVYDDTDDVLWEESEWGTRAWRGEATSSTIRIRDEFGRYGAGSSGINLPAGLTLSGVLTRNVVQFQLGSNILWQGRVGNADYSRSLKADRARDVEVYAEDVNIDQRGMVVHNWVRPEESDVARVQGLIAEFYSGSPSPTRIWQGSNLVNSGSNLVTLPAQTYLQTTGDQILADIAAAADKTYYLLPPRQTGTTYTAELFYDGNDAVMELSPFRISDRPDEVRANPDWVWAPIWNVGPALQEVGQEFVSGIWLFYGSAPDQYVHVTSPSARQTYAHWEDIVFDDKITTAQDATRKAQQILNFRRQHERTINCTIGPLRDQHIASIRAGQTISIKARPIPHADDQYLDVRISQLKITSPLPSVYFVHLELERPKRLGPFRQGLPPGPKPPDPATPPVSGSTYRLYMSNHEAGEGATTPAQDDAPDLNGGAEDAGWTDRAAAVEWYMLYGTPANSVTLSNRNFTATGWGAGHYFITAGMVELDGPDDPSGDLLAIVQAGGELHVQTAARSRYGVGINEGAQNDKLAACVRVYRPGSGFIGTALAVGTIGDLKLAAQSTAVNRTGTATLAAVAGAAAGDYLVVELGVEHIGPTTGGAGATITMTDTSGTDLPEDQVTSAAYNSWIELRGASSGGSSGDVPEPIGEEGSAGEEDGKYANAQHVHAHGLLSTSGTRYHDDTHVEVTGTDGVSLGGNLADALDLLASKLDGGTTGQVLKKSSGDDFDMAWATDATGGGGSLTSDSHYIATQQSTSSTSFTDLATTGPTVTVTVGASGLLLVMWRAQWDTTGIISVALSGANTVAASDDWLLYNNTGQQIAAGASHMFTGLSTGSTTVTMKYRVLSGTRNFLRRELIVLVL